MRARAVAVGLDYSQGKEFYRVFARMADKDGSMPLQPDRAMPLIRPPLQKLLGKKNLTTPGRRFEPKEEAVPVDCLENLQLAPGLEHMANCKVVLDFSAGEDLVPLMDPKRCLFATGIPNRDPGQLVLPKNGKYRHPQTGQLVFHGVRPKTNQSKRLLRILRKAEELRVSILVLPELCLDEKCKLALADHFKKSKRRGVRLLVAGSQHVVRGSERHNECVAYLRGRDEALVHRKFEPYEYYEKKTKITYLEHLSAERCIRIYVSRDWSLTLLVCRDFLSDKIVDLLKKLGVAVVLVPALSTGGMEGFAEGATRLATRVQAFVIVANNPVLPTRVPALFSAPRKLPNMLVLYVPRKQNSATTSAIASDIPIGQWKVPALCWFEPRQTTYTLADHWVPC
jgi:hypothetical protein